MCQNFNIPFGKTILHEKFNTERLPIYPKIGTCPLHVPYSYGGIYKDKNNFYWMTVSVVTLCKGSYLILSLLVLVNYNINLTTTNLNATFSEKTFTCLS